VTSPFDARPIVVAVAGPNGAGKSTFFAAHLQPAGLRFVNADEIGRDLSVGPYEAAGAAGQIRQALLEQRESFVFETVFSDPVGDKLAFLGRAEKAGYTVVLCFVGIDGPEQSEERVAMRVLQGGHDVPTSKLRARFPRTMKNLKDAIRALSHVLIFDNGDLGRPFRKVATYQRGKLVASHPPLPAWMPGQRPRR
jgi:predicted ABC-type ATPase